MPWQVTVRVEPRPLTRLAVASALISVPLVRGSVLGRIHFPGRWSNVTSKSPHLPSTSFPRYSYIDQVEGKDGRGGMNTNYPGRDRTLVGGLILAELTLTPCTQEHEGVRKENFLK